MSHDFYGKKISGNQLRRVDIPIDKDRCTNIVALQDIRTDFKSFF